MSKIHVMNETLANKIAAGEVIERVSSVVKELVENSIDAKAKSIKIELENSGIKKLVITDDGIGMDREDAKLAFSRHATSKLLKDDDLFFINTLGFRGEALPSIASISKVKITSSIDGYNGYFKRFEGGSLVEENIVMIDGRLSIREDDATKIVAREIKNFGEAKPKMLTLNITNATEEQKAKLRGAIKYFNGEQNNISVVIKIGDDLKACGAIYLTDEILQVFEEIIGKENCIV